MKTCIKCSQLLPLDKFYTHPQMKDGHLRVCKECTRKDVAARIARVKQNPQWVEKERARAREKAHRRWQAGFRPRQRKLQKYDAKRRVNKIVDNAIRRGALTRLPCQICGASRVHAHHPDYSKPLEVVWLCPVHHGEQHRKAA